jgi:plasmid stabilization system protein ParE
MPRKYRVRFTRSATVDIGSIYDHIHRDRPRAALAFVEELERQIDSLERLPLRCPIIPESDELGVPYRHLIYGEYRTIFRIVGNTVYILRVIHGARLLDVDILGSL